MRAAGKVRKTRYDELDEALTELEREGRELEAGADGTTAGGTLIRRLEPVQIVVARLELSGPRAAARRDRRARRRLERGVHRPDAAAVLEQRDGESAYDALRRELA